MICVAIVAISGAVGSSVSAHYDSQCKIAGMQANKTQEEIKEICK